MAAIASVSASLRDDLFGTGFPVRLNRSSNGLSFGVVWRIIRLQWFDSLILWQTHANCHQLSTWLVCCRIPLSCLLGASIITSPTLECCPAFVGSVSICTGRLNHHALDVADIVSLDTPCCSKTPALTPIYSCIHQGSGRDITGNQTLSTCSSHDCQTGQTRSTLIAQC